MSGDGQSAGGTDRDCFKCGGEIRCHTSAYNPWDEVFTLSWTPASDDEEFVEESESGGKHPEKETRWFCSRDCLDAFIQMDYSMKPRNVRTGTDQEADQ